MPEYHPSPVNRPVDMVIQYGLADLHQLRDDQPGILNPLDDPISLPYAVSCLQYFDMIMQRAPGRYAVIADALRTFQTLDPSRHAMAWPDNTLLVLMLDTQGLYGFAPALLGSQNALYYTRPAARVVNGGLGFGIVTVPYTVPELVIRYGWNQTNVQAMRSLNFETSGLDGAEYVALASTFVNEPFRFRVVGNCLVLPGSE